MAGVYDYTPAPKARRFAVVSVIGTALLCVISQMTINLGVKTFSFLMIPTFAIYLWPRGANPILSLVGICMVGFFQDYLSYGPLGVWSLCWLLLFLIYRPDMRVKPETLIGQWAGAFLVLLCVSSLQWVLGQFVLGQAMSLQSLILSAAAAFTIFPLIYFIRVNFARMASDGDDFHFNRAVR